MYVKIRQKHSRNLHEHLQPLAKWTSHLERVFPLTTPLGQLVDPIFQ